MARSCLRRRTTRVLFRPYLDTDVSTVCSTGLSLISFNSLDDVDNVLEPTILSSSSLSEPKVEVSSRSGVPFSMPDKILLAICTLYMTLSLAIPLKHNSMTYQVQIKFMNFQRRYLVRILQLLSFNVVVILLQSLRLLPFTFSSSLFLTHFNLSKVINIVLLYKLLRDNSVPRKFSFCLVVCWI